ncbi:hypothetical protein, partial [Nostoc sp.]|uniref:hypothetical protein n=1 Tax=Nostoc sp. TaxID=1180 RepID=UPI002FF60ED9
RVLEVPVLYKLKSQLCKGFSYFEVYLWISLFRRKAIALCLVRRGTLSAQLSSFSVRSSSALSIILNALGISSHLISQLYLSYVFLG